jgi:probable addiction module antidote protein
MPLKTTRWDVTEFLDSEERVAFFLDAILDEGDPALLTAALGDIARARGMTAIAKETGITREALYRALSKAGRPEFNTIVKVLSAFRLRLSVKPTRRKPVKAARRKRQAGVSKTRRAA